MVVSLPLLHLDVSSENESNEDDGDEEASRNTDAVQDESRLDSTTEVLVIQLVRSHDCKIICFSKKLQFFRPPLRKLPLTGLLMYGSKFSTTRPLVLVYTGNNESCNPVEAKPSTADDDEDGKNGGINCFVGFVATLFLCHCANRNHLKYNKNF